MKINRFQYSFRENASKLHKAIGDALRDPNGPFSKYKIFQEYPVERILPSYPHTNHHFDWVVLDLCIVIEGMGEQHYKATSWTSDTSQQEENFVATQRRDMQKMDAAVLVGFTYLEIPYSDLKKVDAQYLYDLYQACKNPNPVLNKPKDPYKERAKEIRRQQYQEMKKRKAR